jgi:hypothetical protein
MSVLREVGEPFQTTTGEHLVLFAAPDKVCIALQDSNDRLVSLGPADAARLAWGLAEALGATFHTVRPGEVPEGRRGVPERPEPDPCKVCGKPIQAGQCYVLSVPGPAHVVCAPPSRVDVARIAAAARER